jgi:hypothetical protein
MLKILGGGSVFKGDEVENQTPSALKHICIGECGLQLHGANGHVWENI